MRCALILGVVVSGAMLIPGCREDEPPDSSAGETGRQEQTSQSTPQKTTLNTAQEVDKTTQPEEDGRPLLDPLGPNAGCYVCHMVFVGEELTSTHAEAGIGCIDCHGISAGHANDENIGATSPDIVIKGDQVNVYCRTCHQTHDAPPEQVIAQWIELSKAKATTQPAEQTATCTDCHGQHRISE